MIEILRAPHLGTAEEDVLVAEWMVEEGEDFRKGQVLVVLETLKASFEIEAEADGTLHRRLAAEGERVGLQAALGLWGEPGAELVDAQIAGLLEQAQAPSIGPAGGAGLLDPISPPETAGARTAAGAERAVVAAPAARRRASELGIDLARLRGTGPDGLIRLADVEAGVAMDSAATPGSDGRLDATFLEHVKREPEAFAALASDFKVDLYRRHGALIGHGARIGPGSVLLTERLVLGADCVIREQCRVEAREFVAGDLLFLGPRSRVRATRVELGDNAFFAEEAEIGGGGGLDPESNLTIGSHGFVGEGVHLNPCRGIHIGDEVVLSRGAVIMTHSFGGSLLAGFPVRFAPVTIGDGAQVGIGATLFPGVEMGAGSILLSGSSLVTSVPAGRLYGGVPATDQKAAFRPLAPAEFARRAREMVLEFARQLRLRGMQVETAEPSSPSSGDPSVAALGLTVTHENRTHRLNLRPELCADELAGSDASVSEEVWVGLSVAAEVWESIGSDRVAVDLSVPRIRGVQGPLADAWREFLRKHGVRLRPRSWSYGGGWL